MKLLTVGIIFLGFTTSQGAFAQSNQQSSKPQAPKYLMAAMGDSITAGFLAGTELSWFNQGAESFTTDSVEAEQFIANVEQNYRLSMASFPVVSAVAHVFESRKTFSWATGKKIQSHYMLLQSAIQKVEPAAKFAAYDIALSGGLTKDLFSQADNIVSKMNSGKYSALKYITLLIGNNDVCHKADVNQIKTNMHEVFQKLSAIKQNEPVRILMSGLPRIPDVGAPAVSQSKTIFNLTCSELRKYVTHTCPPLVNWTTQSEYNDAIAKVQAVNEALYESANDANKSFQNLNVVFSNRLFDHEILPSNLAVDCFHPTKETQSQISQELWQDQPWFH